MSLQSNPEIDQDRTADLVETFRRHGVVMFRQQRAIYRQIAERVAKKTVLEVGCGLGTGSAMIHEASLLSDSLLATDKLGVNVAFAREMYPWVKFAIWDASVLRENRAQAVVAVEMIEHVVDPVKVLRNLWAAATEELWISTPNGTGKPRPPSNPFHVCEYTPSEVIGMLEDAGCRGPAAKWFDIFGWEDFSPRGLDTLVDPLVYRVRR